MTAVFLDRDGVLNRPLVRSGKPYATMTMDELELLPGVEYACADLKKAGFLLVMVTNQPEIERGNVARDVVDSMNDSVARVLGLDVVKLCPHDDARQCPCRKPKPGLLQEVERDFGIDLSASYFVGDRWRDIAAGQNAGCKTVFIDHGYLEQRPTNPDFVTSSLTAATQWILQSASNHGGNNAKDNV
jgi:D-glycero-D-manno-heptose 1,7-bisphosphate phosphatase